MKRISLIATPLFIIMSWLSCAIFGGAVEFQNRAETQQPQAAYYPEAGAGWQRKRPEEVGMDSALLDQAIAFARSQETRRPRDYSDQEQIFGKLLGPIPKERGGTNGVVLRHGYLVAEFGETGRVEPTYSVAKSVLSTLLGLAIDRGLIKSVEDP